MIPKNIPPQHGPKPATGMSVFDSAMKHVRFSKRTYSTNIKVAFCLGLLPPELAALIPSSTKADWRRRGFTHFFGLNFPEPVLGDIQFHREFVSVPALRAIAKALFRLYRFYARATGQLRGAKKFWKNNREKIVAAVQSLRPAFGLKRACRMLRITVSKFYRWRDAVACVSSSRGVCRKRHPTQISSAEERAVRDYVNDPRFAGFSIVNIWLQMMRDGAAAFGLSTFRKYARMCGTTPERFHKARPPAGIRAERKLELLHMDSTVFHLADRRRMWIHLIIDNYSRAILGWRLMESNRSLEVAANLREVCETYKLREKGVVVLADDGSENQGAVTEFLAEPGVMVRRLIAQVDIRPSNSMVEAVNKVLKNQFLLPLKTALRTARELEKALAQQIERYNHTPKFALHGLTPAEVLAGQIPDPKIFADALRDARIERIAVNRAAACGVC